LRIGLWRNMTNLTDSPLLSLKVGLVMDFYNPGILEGAQSYFEEVGIRLDGRWAVRSDWLPEDAQWDGVIHGIIDDPSTLARVRAMDGPAVSLIEHDDREGDGEYCVVPDYERCGELAVHELIDFGCKHIYLQHVSTNKIDKQFVDGALKVVKKTKTPHTLATFDSVELDKFRTLIDKTVDTLVSFPKPTGFCFPHAGACYSIVNQLLKRGVKIPEEVAMVVIDKDVHGTSSMAACPVSGVKLNEWYRGFVAAEKLHNLMLGEKQPQRLTRIQPTGINKRESTGAIQKHDLSTTKALSYLRKFYGKDISVKDIVMVSGVSRRTLEIRFRKLLNTSIYDELYRVRIEAAKRLLTEQSLTITQIASQCGFSSLHYFSRTFKKCEGVSPKEYRNLAK